MNTSLLSTNESTVLIGAQFEAKPDYNKLPKVGDVWVTIDPQEMPVIRATDGTITELQAGSRLVIDDIYVGEYSSDWQICWLLEDDKKRGGQNKHVTRLSSFSKFFLREDHWLAFVRDLEATYTSHITDLSLSNEDREGAIGVLPLISAEVHNILGARANTAFVSVK